jgi:putative DNA primase/helicase
MLNAARSLSQCPEVVQLPQAPKQPAAKKDENRPGDDFNARATWDEILVPHGWVPLGTRGEETRWCRPGKPDGVSASTNTYGRGLLHVYSTNAEPFENGESYKKFAAFAILNCGGNFKRAAQELRAMGYGKQTR